MLNTANTVGIIWVPIDSVKDMKIIRISNQVCYPIYLAWCVV